MAQVVSTEIVKCPYCGATGLVRVYSCGCQGVSRSGQYGGHNTQDYECQNLGFFTSFERNCGQSGYVRDHA